MSDFTPLTSPRFTTPWSRTGTAIDEHAAADLAALRDSIAVRQIAGDIAADYDIDAVITDVTRMTSRLRTLDDVFVRDSKSNLERREHHYRTRLHKPKNPLPADLFQMDYHGTYRRATVHVTLTVNPAEQTPTLTMKVHGIDMSPGHDGTSTTRYADLYARRALAAELTTLTV
jgi:hypothetical protein